MSRIDWPGVVQHAAGIVDGYSTGVTLRQLFYRLVADGTLPNTTAAYKGLPAHTAEARREDGFPDLIDRGRKIHQATHFTDVGEALRVIVRAYRLDRTQGQDVSLYLGVEKNGMVEQLSAWSGGLGVPILALGGYSSQTYVADVIADVEAQARPAVLLYAGDFDPSGEDIDRDFEERTGCWDHVVRVALSAGQVTSYRLPPNPGKVTDSRAGGFIARHGQLVQVELDALDPNDLRALFQAAVDGYWDVSAYEAVLDRERDDLRRLREVAGGAT